VAQIHAEEPSMRPVLLLFAAALAVSAAPAAFGQTAAGAAAPPPPAPPPQSDQVFSTSTKAVDLTGLNLKIEQDETVMTRIRDAELARENARLRAIKPALPFHGPTFMPDPFL